jgi:hypothetical protein
VSGSALGSAPATRAGAAGFLAGSVLVAGQYLRIYAGRTGAQQAPARP